MTGPKPPSWWQYVAGRDADRKWSAFYASTVGSGGAFSKRDLAFYLGAVTRLAADSYPTTRHRPPHVVNFWLTCHYQLRITLASPKAAAIDTACLAAEAGIAKGHTPKAIQRHATQLRQPAVEFLDAVRSSVEAALADSPSDAKMNDALIEWTGRMVRRSVQ